MSVVKSVLSSNFKSLQKRGQRNYVLEFAIVHTNFYVLKYIYLQYFFLRAARKLCVGEVKAH